MTDITRAQKIQVLISGGSIARSRTTSDFAPPPPSCYINLYNIISYVTLFLEGAGRDCRGREFHFPSTASRPFALGYLVPWTGGPSVHQRDLICKGGKGKASVRLGTPPGLGAAEYCPSSESPSIAGRRPPCAGSTATSTGSEMGQLASKGEQPFGIKKQLRKFF